MILSAPVLVREMLPLPVLTALKLETVFALVSVVPPTDEVVSSAPLITPAPVCCTSPAVPVREMLPLALFMLPAPIVM